MRKLMLVLPLMLLSFVGFASVGIPTIPTEVTANSTVDAVMFLITNWKQLGGFGIASTIIIILIQVLRGPWCGDWFGKQSALVKRIILVILGQALSVLTAIYAGQVWYVAIIQGLFVTGGAIAIYEVFKPIFNKKK